MLQEKDGIITSSDITKATIPRIYLKFMTDKGLIVKIDRGIYSLPEVWEMKCILWDIVTKKAYFLMVLHFIYIECPTESP